MKYIVLLALLFVGQASFGQIRDVVKRTPGIRDDIKSKRRLYRKLRSKEEYVLHKKMEENFWNRNSSSSKEKGRELRPDTIYCTWTKKQHGWFAPLDTISKECAMHRGWSYRFTNRNRAGKWQRMEVIDAYGRYCKGSLNPYILNLSSADTDQSAQADWVEKIKTSCIYEFIADPSGKTIIQERAYDEKMNIVYAFSRVPIGNNQFIGSYRDYYGLPAEMRRDEGYVYGTLVKITEDRYGNDSIVQYIDAKGTPKLNSDSAAMEVFIYDEYGHLLKSQSRNADGSLAIDNWGNCGVEHIWNDQHQLISMTCMDANWRPMRMPDNREKSGRVITTNYRYDKYQRRIEAYYDSLGIKDCDEFGTHRIVYEYDDRGNNTKSCGYSIDGKPSPMDQSMTSCGIYAYDDNGRILEGRWLDKNGKPNPNMGYLSKKQWKYDEYGNEILVKSFSTETGKEQLTSMEEKSKEHKYTLWNNGTYRIDSLDEKGRTTFYAYYKPDGTLNKFDDGSSYARYRYIDDGQYTTYVRTSYDDQHKKYEIDGVAERIVQVDSIHRSEKKFAYDANGALSQTYIHQYDKGFHKIMAEYDMNIFGVATRAGGTANVRHLKGAILYDIKNEKYSSLYGIDEFDEPDYIASPTIIYYYQKTRANAGTLFYDEFNQPITIAKRDSLPKVMSVEVIDSSAYALGLRDNDVIIVDGDYSTDLDSVYTYNQFVTDWILSPIVASRKKRDMVVFRVNPITKEYGLVKIPNLKGSPSQNGFITHVRYLTQKQKKRIQRTITDNLNSANPVVSLDDFKVKRSYYGKNPIVLCYNETYRSIRESSYFKQIKDPSVLVAATIDERGIAWKTGDELDNLKELQDTKSRTEGVYIPTLSYFYTKDGETILQLDSKDKNDDIHLFYAEVSDNIYEKIIRQTESASEIIRKSTVHIDEKRLIGSWTVVSEEGYNTSGTFELEENHVARGHLTFFKDFMGLGARAVFKITTDLTGRWELSGGMLSFIPEHQDSIFVSCVDFVDTNEEVRNYAINSLNNSCRVDGKALLKACDFKNIIGELYIRSIVQDSLIFEDGSAAGLKLVRKKGNTPKEKNTKQRSKASISKRVKALAGTWTGTVYHGNVFISIAMDIMGTGEFSFTMDCPTPLTYGGHEITMQWGLEFQGLFTQMDESIVIQFDMSKLDFNIQDITSETLSQEELKVCKEEALREIEANKVQMCMQMIKSMSLEQNIPIVVQDKKHFAIGTLYFQRVE